MLFADAFPRDLYRCLMANHVVGAALDVDRQRGVNLRTATVNMYGQPRQFLTGTMQIALRCGATVLQGFLLSRRNYYFHLVISGPLVDPDTERDEPAVLAEVMQRYADGIEKQVRRRPCHLSKL